MAAQRGILRPVLPKVANLRCSLYADDAAIFADLTHLELDHLYKILKPNPKTNLLNVNDVYTYIVQLIYTSNHSKKNTKSHTSKKVY
jgi:hypothetical protein